MLACMQLPRAGARFASGMVLSARAVCSRSAAFTADKKHRRYGNVLKLAKLAEEQKKLVRCQRLSFFLSSYATLVRR